MKTKQPTALALTAGWTDAPVTLMNSGNAGALTGAGVTYNDVGLNATCTNTSTFGTFQVGGYGWPWRDYWYPYYVPIYTEQNRRPVKLTMGEVERLRVAAKKDKALRETLEKFTDHIEVVVDFGIAK